jgi:RNA polymerase sigma factor (sigma-70 family)
VNTPSTPEPPVVADQTRWFAEEVHPHDSSLKAYVRGAFPAIRDVEEVVQESYLRIWKARAASPILSARAFLFRIARNICLDTVKSSTRSQVDAVGDLSAISVSEYSDSVVDSVSGGEKLQILTDALAALPSRCREVFMLCKFQGYSHADAAAKLGLSTRTVDAQIQNAFVRLGTDLRKRGLTSSSG